MLAVQNVHTFYGKSHILQGISLEIGEGAILSVLGRNGVGKTTMIRSIMGLLHPSDGRIFFQNRDITRLPPYLRVKAGIGLVPQGRLIFPSLRVHENLTINARTSDEKHGQDWDMDRILERFPRLRERLHHKGNQLSGGEQQMLAIGRALMGNPKLLLMDEPSEGLAPVIVEEIGKLLSELKARTLSILLVEQNFHFSTKIADQVLIMNKGRFVYGSSSSEILANHEIRRTYLGV
jgi:branched-chain amino acid transport system ATP-binding protein